MQLSVEGVMPDLGGRERELVVRKRSKEREIFNYTDSALTFSMSSQLVTMPCSMGYFRVRIFLLL